MAAGIMEPRKTAEAVFVLDKIAPSRKPPRGVACRIVVKPLSGVRYRSTVE